ncbi:MAG: C39 family peptidase [Candidatus Peregrinibacteria bacterium]
MKKVLFISLLALSACSVSEGNFKSTVPVGTRVESPAQVLEALPLAVNHDVPFFPQAPDADWRLPWQETCEEASVVLAYYYAMDRDLTIDLFRQEILNLVSWQTVKLGDYKHTNAAQTARILGEYYAFSDFEIVENPSVEQLQRSLSQGSVIVAPFAGRMLGNPFFRQPGPLYHMLVIKGYDQKHFITNDVGTRRGENFIYPYETLMSALHEWHDTTIELGAKKVIVVRPY